eukprot:Nk52_evm34s158 gene=Nk52_evmTU34s158
MRISFVVTVVVLLCIVGTGKAGVLERRADDDENVTFEDFDFAEEEGLALGSGGENNIKCGYDADTNTITVTNIPPGAGCVMRPDNYQDSQVPVYENGWGTVTFTNVPLNLPEVEIYETLVSKTDCIGFLGVSSKCSGTGPVAPWPLGGADVRCVRSGTTVTVSNMPPQTECVMRTDTYTSVFTVYDSNGKRTAVFENVEGQLFNSVELYDTLGDGPNSCSGFIHVPVVCLDE